MLAFTKLTDKGVRTTIKKHIMYLVTYRIYPVSYLYVP